MHKPVFVEQILVIRPLQTEEHIRFKLLLFVAFLFQCYHVSVHGVLFTMSGYVVVDYIITFFKIKLCKCIKIDFIINEDNNNLIIKQTF